MAKAKTPIDELMQLIEKHGSQKAVGEALGISQQHVCDLVSGRRNVSEAIAAQLGFRRTWVEVKRV